MDEHERTVKAAQQVDKRIGFYVHFVVFLLVCAGLAAVNWFATPEVWWAQWPFLGWGGAVVFHALCAFGGGPNFIAAWRLRKIRELTAPERAGGTGRTASNPMKRFGILLLGILVGCAAGGGYMYVLLQNALEKVTIADASREKLSETVKTQEAQLKEAQAAKSSLDTAVKETREQVRQLQLSKQEAERALKDQLSQAQAAREAAEKALAEAKKATAQ
jgi:uncharacterized membrane protein